MDTKEDSIKKRKKKKKKSNEKKQPNMDASFGFFFLNTPRVLDPPLQPTSQ